MPSNLRDHSSEALGIYEYLPLHQWKNIAWAHMEVSITGGSPIAGWLLLENPSINGWFRGTHISGNLQKKCWLVGWWPGGERSRVHHVFPPWMILQADSWPVLLELFLSKLLVSDYLMTVFDEKCSLKSVRYPIIAPSILYTSSGDIFYN